MLCDCVDVGHDRVIATDNVGLLFSWIAGRVVHVYYRPAVLARCYAHFMELGGRLLLLTFIQPHCLPGNLRLLLVALGLRCVIETVE